MYRALTALIAALLISGATAEPETGTYATFNWFEYSGRDPVFEMPAGENSYRNPILAGFYPDPSVVQVGEDYYLVNSSFAYFPAIPIFHSRDLVNWTQIGNVIDRPSQLDFKHLGISRGVFAPAINHRNGTFYLVSTCVNCGGNFVVTAEDPAGPWSGPVWLPQMGGIDPSLFSTITAAPISSITTPLSASRSTMATAHSGYRNSTRKNSSWLARAR